MTSWDLVMNGLACGGSIALYTAVRRLVALGFEDSQEVLSKLTSSKLSESSSFAALESKKGLLAKLDVWLLNRLGLKPRLEETYLLMGSPVSPTPLQMLRYKKWAALGLLAFTFLMTYSPLALIFMPLGFFIPDVIFSGKIQKRQGEVLRNFPALVDLAALTIESGLDYMSALDRILKTSYRKTELEKEVEKTLKEVQLGYSRREALRRFAQRTGIQEVRSFVGLIIQSDELGTSLVDLLRNFSTDMRFRRLNRAEKMAAQASTKMLIPLFIFIFPTVFILMLAPMVMELVRGGLPF
ncbi:MAG: type II secretion system F family protein [Elusimicrobia bacterium]|nr:type II secretion system F family protein [Elusimicrobiota bacterium]